MKKLMLFVVAGLVAFSSLSYADNKMTPEQMVALKHANPMPNLMLVVGKNQEKLKLTDQQKKALSNWVEASMPRLMNMVQAVGKLEKNLHDAALAGASGPVLKKIATQLFNVRGAIIQQKLACRNNLARVLSKEQMQQVIKLYKEENA